MDMQKELENVKKIIEEVADVTKVSLGGNNDPSKIQDMKLEDIDAMLGKIQGLVDKLNEQSDHLLKEMGMTKEQMMEYIQNPANFSKEQWEVLQFMKNEADKFQNSVKQVTQGTTAGKTEQIAKQKQKSKRPGDKGTWTKA